jgi:hypothetical protein
MGASPQMVITPLCEAYHPIFVANISEAGSGLQCPSSAESQGNICRGYQWAHNTAHHDFAASNH